MSQFDENTIRETAYYIWKDNGCPAGTCHEDWNAAIELLERKDVMRTLGTVSSLYKKLSIGERLSLDLKKAGKTTIPFALSKAFAAPSSASAKKKTAKKSK